MQDWHGISIRESVPGDLELLDRLYVAAFPEEELFALVRDLTGPGAGVLSLVAEADVALAGHIAFSDCTLEGDARTLALLGPLAVAPSRQRQGVGRALIDAGRERLAERGVAAICVLGDPAYYGRIGFSVERGIEPPYRLPEEWGGAWQSMVLTQGPPPRGKLQVPPLWQAEALWLP